MVGVGLGLLEPSAAMTRSPGRQSLELKGQNETLVLIILFEPLHLASLMSSGAEYISEKNESINY